MLYQRLTLLSALVLCPFVFVSDSAADVVFVIDLDRNTSGLQSVLSVQAGETLNAGLLLQVTNTGTATDITSYQTSIAIDKSVFRFTDPTFILAEAPRFGDPTLLDWFSGGIPATVDDSGLTGVPYTNYLGITGISGLSLPPTKITDFSYEIVRFDLVANNTGDVRAATGSDPGNVTVGPFGADDNIFGIGPQPIPPGIIGYNDAAAVPEPSAFALAGLCVFGIGYRQRRKAKRVKETQPLA